MGTSVNGVASWYVAAALWVRDDVCAGHVVHGLGLVVEDVEHARQMCDAEYAPGAETRMQQLEVPAPALST